MREHMRCRPWVVCRILAVFLVSVITAAASAERPIDGWGHGRKERAKEIFERVKHAWDPDGIRQLGVR